MVSLISQIRSVCIALPDPTSLFDEGTVETLGLTYEEVQVWVALLTTLSFKEAQEKVGANYDDFKAIVVSLIEKGLLKVVDNQLSFLPALESLRFGHAHEQERDLGFCLEEGEAPSLKLKLRPLRERVAILARTQPPTRGLARVYALLYGGTFTNATFKLLSKYIQALGVEDAALFLLKHAHGQYRNPLEELLPLALSEKKEYRPEGVPSAKEQQMGERALVTNAFMQRMRIWKRREAEGENPRTFGTQYVVDMKYWQKIGCPPV